MKRSTNCAPATNRFGPGTTLLFTLLLLISSGCQTRPPVTVTGCPVDESLLAELPMPSRPPKVPVPSGMGHTHAQWLQSWEDVRQALREDNAKKTELRRQLTACRLANP